MTNSQIQAIVKAAVTETLLGLGLAVNNPTELQKDFAHLRNLRQGCEATRRSIIKSVVTVTVPSGLYIVWQAIKSLINQP